MIRNRDLGRSEGMDLSKFTRLDRAPDVEAGLPEGWVKFRMPDGLELAVDTKSAGSALLKIEMVLAELGAVRIE
ncbi:hypothetical protein ACYPKM_02470 [Pseudomonas aeruginosa]